MRNQIATGLITAAAKRDALRAADGAIRPLPEALDVDDLVNHNAGYRAYATDRQALFAERERFVRALDLVVTASQSGTVVDLGCFVPHLPVALARLGYQTRIVERFDLHGPSFRSELERLRTAEGIDAINADLSSDDLAELGEHDVVLLDCGRGAPERFPSSTHA